MRRAPTTVSLRRLVPGLYERADGFIPRSFWGPFLDVLEAELNLILGGGVDSSGRDLTPVSVDAMADVFDPVRAEARMLRFIAQKFGWDLDTSTAEALQRKIVSLAGQLLRLKGTRQGIIAALRLLLAIEVEIREPWADVWHLAPDELYFFGDVARGLGGVAAGDTVVRHGWITPLGAAGLLNVTVSGAPMALGLDYTEQRDGITLAVPLGATDTVEIRLPGIAPYIDPSDLASLATMYPRPGRLGVDAYLAPDQHAPGYARGSITCDVGPSGLGNHWKLESAGWSSKYEMQLTARAGGEDVWGLIKCPDPGLLLNNMTLTVPSDGAGPFTFEVKRDAGFAFVGSSRLIDVSAATTPADVAVAIAFGINASGSTTIATATREYVYLTEPNVKAVGNVALTGSALDVLEVVGMTGGAPTAAFAPLGGAYTRVSLIGATTAADVARRLYLWIGYTDATLSLRRDDTTISLRKTTTGAGGDGAIELLSGTAPVAGMTFTGMTGGAESPNPAVYSFSVAFPRALTDDELRVARAVVRLMKPAHTHEHLLVPRDPLWSYLDVGGPGGLSVDDASGHLSRRFFRAPTGTAAADPARYVVGPALWLALDAAAATRSIKLVIGGRYVVDTDDDCYIRQGGSGVTAAGGDAILAANTTRSITVPSPRAAYLSVLQVVAAPGKYVRLTRVDADAPPSLLP